MGKKQPQLQKVAKRELKLGGRAGPREQPQCGKVPAKESAAGGWDKDAEEVIAALGRQGRCASTPKAEVLGRAGGDTEG